MSAWLITSVERHTDIVRFDINIMQYVFLKNQLNIWYLVNNLIYGFSTVVSTDIHMGTVYICGLMSDNRDIL